MYYILQFAITRHALNYSRCGGELTYERIRTRPATERSNWLFRKRLHRTGARRLSCHARHLRGVPDCGLRATNSRGEQAGACWRSPSLPVVLRLALLPNHPIPTPDIYDEFATCWSRIRCAISVWRIRRMPCRSSSRRSSSCKRPTYSSIYPDRPGIALAIGWMIFGTPWAGVLLSTAALCSLCYWMLRGWTTPAWALARGRCSRCSSSAR